MTVKDTRFDPARIPSHDTKGRRPRRLPGMLLGLWLITAAGLLNGAGAHAQAYPQGHPATVEAPSVAGGVARIEVLGGAFTQGAPVAGNQSRIVLYRVKDNRPGASSVFVDKRYHASLVSGAWSQLCYSSGAVELGVRQMEAVTRAAKDPYDSISALSLQPGQTHYLSVGEADGRPLLRPVLSSQALQEITGTREQLHTVSRVAQTCEAGPPMAPQVYTLSTDTLFAFDRSDRDGMTEAGMRAIDQLLGRLDGEFSSIERIHLIGHADPLGNAERNETLSIERARTVHVHLLQTRRIQAPITTEGRGSREPLVRDCGTQATPQAMVCNQANRRVSIEVVGTRR